MTGSHRHPRRGAVAVVVLALLATPAMASAHGRHDPHAQGSGEARLYVPPADRDGVRQVRQLERGGDLADAWRVARMLTTPQAVWFTGGTPHRVERQVRDTMRRAWRQRALPTLVAYDLPYRDCAQYSAGGAADTAAYEAWIDGFARGLGRGQAIVILEPDGLGIIPWYKPLYGDVEWCRPVDANGNPAPEADAAHRFAQLNYAVDRLGQAGAGVYLDGTHSAWLGAGEAADRLLEAGVQRAAGFFVNVSNHQPTDQSTQYGTWVASCIAAVTEGASWAIGHPEYCPGQYVGSSVDYGPQHVADVDASFGSMLDGASPTTHFVIDTSRNGRGANDMSAYAHAPYDQPPAVIAALRGGNWCNPPGAGLGLRPATDTGVGLLDAYLWVKTPGQSDGSCDIAGGARAWDYGSYDPWGVAPDQQDHFDPLWGMVDPAAGEWFPEQALQLARLAQPPLTRR